MVRSPSLTAAWSGPRELPPALEARRSGTASRSRRHSQGRGQGQGKCSVAADARRGRRRRGAGRCEGSRPPPAPYSAARAITVLTLWPPSTARPSAHAPPPPPSSLRRRHSLPFPPPTLFGSDALRRSTRSVSDAPGWGRRGEGGPRVSTIGDLSTGGEGGAPRREAEGVPSLPQTSLTSTRGPCVSVSPSRRLPSTSPQPSGVKGGRGFRRGRPVRPESGPPGPTTNPLP